jgi:nitrile hydratase accessory protein
MKPPRSHSLAAPKGALSGFGRPGATEVDAALSAVAPLPRDDAGPVFAAPWQAQAFALAVQLHAQGLFTWPQWAEALAAEIRAAGAGDDGSRYYEHWVAALEKLVAARGAADASALSARADAWRRAAAATPHGSPITLDNDPLAAR